jgi:hypothetical protein
MRRIGVLHGFGLDSVGLRAFSCELQRVRG